MADATNPESWRVVPGSVGFNEGNKPKRDGGCTADAWAFSAIGDELFASACEYSVTENKNYLIVQRATIEDDAFFTKNDTFRYGAVRTQGYNETSPVVEYAIGKNASLEFEFQSEGNESYGFIGLGPSDAPMFQQGVAFEFSPTGCRINSYDDKNHPTVLAEGADNAPKWEPGKTWRLRMTRAGNELVAFVDNQEVVRTRLNENILAQLEQNPRFKLYGWQGGTYTIHNAILTDGLHP